jgi:hypothetical protein
MNNVMKKEMFSIVLPLLIIMGSISIKAQDITFIPHDTLLVGVVGTEMIFDITATNISAQSQTLFMVRTLNDLPADWTSSLCFEFCAAPWVDSLVTITPFSPGESRTVSVHVFPLNNPGIAHIKIKVGTFRSPNINYNVNLTTIAGPTSANDKTPSLNNFSLSQNYPNPFNPTTKIKYAIPLADSPLLGGARGGFATLKVYDVLGNKVATLVNEYKPAGNYELDFDGGNLPSGIYLYRLTALNFSQTHKMILEK